MTRRRGFEEICNARKAEENPGEIVVRCVSFHEPSLVIHSSAQELVDRNSLWLSVPVWLTAKDGIRFASRYGNYPRGMIAEATLQLSLHPHLCTSHECTSNA